MSIYRRSHGVVHLHLSFLAARLHPPPCFLFHRLVRSFLRSHFPAGKSGVPSNLFTSFHLTMDRCGSHQPSQPIKRRERVTWLRAPRVAARLPKNAWCSHDFDGSRSVICGPSKSKSECVHFGVTRLRISALRAAWLQKTKTPMLARVGLRRCCVE